MSTSGFTGISFPYQVRPEDRGAALVVMRNLEFLRDQLVDWSVSGVPGPPGPSGPAGPRGPAGGEQYTRLIGDGSSKVFTVTHNLGLAQVQVTVYRSSPPYDEVVCEVEHTTVNMVTIRTITTPATNEYYVVCSGPGSLSGAGDLTYTHVQSSVADSWSVAHNLGKYPSITVVDTGDTEIVPDVHHDSINHATVNFAAATSGKAFCN